MSGAISWDHRDRFVRPLPSILARSWPPADGVVRSQTVASSRRASRSAVGSGMAVRKTRGELSRRTWSVRGLLEGSERLRIRVLGQERQGGIRPEADHRVGVAGQLVESFTRDRVSSCGPIRQPPRQQ